jgi:hypothetical protein
MDNQAEYRRIASIENDSEANGWDDETCSNLHGEVMDICSFELGEEKKGVKEPRKKRNKAANEIVEVDDEQQYFKCRSCGGKKISKRAACLSPCTDGSSSSSTTSPPVKTSGCPIPKVD